MESFTTTTTSTRHYINGKEYGAYYYQVLGQWINGVNIKNRWMIGRNNSLSTINSDYFKSLSIIIVIDQKYMGQGIEESRILFWLTLLINQNWSPNKSVWIVILNLFLFDKCFKVFNFLKRNQWITSNLINHCSNIIFLFLAN